MSMHRIGAGDHPSQQINVQELRERLHVERLQALAARRPTVRMRVHRAPAPPRVLLSASARRHLAAITVFLGLALFGAGALFTAGEWRNERNTNGWIKSCISCHGRTGIVEQPRPSAVTP